MVESIDLRQLDRPGLIAAWRDGDVLIDCGPTVCVQTLFESLGDWQPKALLLTHIHLDHAGAAGALVARWPELEVWVHERGARHLVSPERLMESAYRVFGPRLDTLFGPMSPVPAERVKPLHGGERIFGFEVAATPGHASHHIAFFDAETGEAYPGDVAGVKLGDGPVVPPTPPPDIDLAAWHASLDRLESWNPQRLHLPHFGAIEDVASHLAQARDALSHHETAAAVGDENTYVTWLTASVSQQTRDEADDYHLVVPPASNYAGLKRYLETRADRESEQT